MYIQQLYTSCLAEAAYYIESNGEAAIIDPIREPQPYLKLAQERQAKIRYVFETHFHADFISGHMELAQATGAVIVFGPGAKTAYQAHEGKDGEIFQLGAVTIELLHTPGHTPESSCYLLRDQATKPHCIFTGDTLFIGDVGRPDLAVSSSCTQEDLARMLYNSLRAKIMPLPDSTIVYPAHGAGSPCGKNISKETFDTLGNQKLTNYALQNISVGDFVSLLTNNIPPAPAYFAQAAARNRDGIVPLSEILTRSLCKLSIDEVKHALAKGAVLLDTRNKASFVSEHIPGSIFIGLEGDFAPWAAKLIKNLDQEIIFVATEGTEEEVVRRLARVGFGNCLGFVGGGLADWNLAGNATESLNQVSASTLEQAVQASGGLIVDVRQPGEFNAGHLKTAINVPLSELTITAQDSSAPGNPLKGLRESNGPVFVHCQGGYRSVIATSILLRNGFNAVTDVAGGYLALKQTCVAMEGGGCSL